MEKIAPDESSKPFVPDFLIIGAQKCGTTSLYNYLIQHPQVIPAKTKEIHFFDIHFKNGWEWYCRQFPMALEPKENCITGEASPYYLFHPHTPSRILQLMPKVKLIILLRNPVDRAYSHYHLIARMGKETLSFKEAIRHEESRIKPELKKMLEDENYQSTDYQYYSYLARGRYVEQLKTWMNLFPKEQFLIIKSEDLYFNPANTFHRVLDFLGLPKYDLYVYKKENYGEYPELDLQLKNQLADYFKPYNRQLYEYIGIDFGW
ncbi:MAG TPA: sulfotransferase domain-containing protein [Bacillus sp. (in: firmicutes)]|uniref:sulfotransferase domain-containing protein n=1 Tax=Bacillus litorisediminis TaxID=2922713 RepID=UPI001FADD194|nr:sulfotransferase domain-containing protein [Bacillus litorisediminis]HWO75382.1 sulfotransferase domain-containing protein [Bacillus sp. (in: firmicutes)]